MSSYIFLIFDVFSLRSNMRFLKGSLSVLVRFLSVNLSFSFLSDGGPMFNGAAMPLPSCSHDSRAWVSARRFHFELLPALPLLLEVVFLGHSSPSHLLAYDVALL